MHVKYDLIIKNGYVVKDDRVEKLDIGVIGEKIAYLKKDMNYDALEIIDAEGLYVFPGIIDAHVHFDEPGRSEWESIACGSASLSAGGGTLFFDMPLNSYPTTCDIETFNDKLALAKKTSYTDFGIWGGLTPKNLDNLEELCEAGVIGFKAFACFTGDSGLMRSDDYTLLEGMRRIKRLNLPLMVHCENAEITRDLTDLFIRENKLSPKDYFNSRPIIAEIENISKIIYFAEETGCKVIIAHVSTERGVNLINEAKKRGLDIYCESIGHYLAFNEEDVERIGTQAKCSPPIRNKENQIRLWAKMLLDEIDFISSDHSPCDPKLKKGEFLTAWNGIASCQSTLPLMLSFGYHDRRFEISKVAKVLSENANKIFNIPNKGKIEIGYDGDFAIVDLNRGFKLKKEDLFYKHKNSLYVDYNFKASVVQTILRGKTIYKDGRIVTEPFGNHVKPIIK